jgi:hypothetical protein
VNFGTRALIKLGTLKYHLKIIHKIASGTRVIAVIKDHAMVTWHA